jgi:glucose/mannose transport system permease protein
MNQSAKVEKQIGPGRPLGGRVLIYTSLVLAAFYFLAPLYVMIVTSLKPMDEIRDMRLLSTPIDWTTAAWFKAWGTACVGISCEGIKGSYLNTLAIVIPSVVLSVGLGAINGFALTKFRFRGDRLVFGLLLVGGFVPFQIVLLPMARLLATLGLFGSLPGLILVHVMLGLSVMTLLFRNYYVSFPDSLISAARIDGAGFFDMFFRILLPVSGPMITVAVIMQFTGIWNDFLFGLTFGRSDTQPVMTALSALTSTSFGEKEYNVNAAATILAALPPLLIYIVSGKYFVRGLTAGAVKG